jgi:mannose-6-phosphate isomerase-like protein (cupin superfamily)
VTRTDLLETNDGYKFFVADGSWYLFDERDRAARPRLRRGDVGEARDAMIEVASARPRESSNRGRRRDTARRQALGPQLIWAVTERYVGKVLVIEAGERLSLQLHRVKDESILVVAGRLRLHLEDDDGALIEAELVPGDHLSIHGPSPPVRGDRARRADRGSAPELDDVVSSRTTTGGGHIRPLSRPTTTRIGG